MRYERTIESYYKCHFTSYNTKKIANSAHVVAWLSRRSNFFKESHIYTSKQNWMGYILMILVFWQSITELYFWSKYWQNQGVGPMKKAWYLDFLFRIEVWEKKPYMQFCRLKWPLFIAIWLGFEQLWNRLEKNRKATLVENTQFLGVISVNQS